MWELGSYSAPTGQAVSHWPMETPCSPGYHSEDCCQAHLPAGGVTGAQVHCSQLPAHQNTWGLKQSPFFPLVSQPAPGRWLCLGSRLTELCVQLWNGADWQVWIFLCLLTSVYKTEWLPAASEGWVCYCINSIIVGRGETSAAEHIKTPHTWAWLLADQGTPTVNTDSQFNENSFSRAIAERDHGQTRACVQIMAQIPNRVLTIAISPGTPRPCANSLTSSCV